MITLEPADFAAKESEFLGVAILDERVRSDVAQWAGHGVPCRSRRAYESRCTSRGAFVCSGTAVEPRFRSRWWSSREKASNLIFGLEETECPRTRE